MELPEISGLPEVDLQMETLAIAPTMLRATEDLLANRPKIRRKPIAEARIPLRVVEGMRTTPKHQMPA